MIRNADELTVRQYFAPAARRWPLLILPILVLPIIVTIATRRQAVEYTVTARVLVAEPAAEAALVGRELSATRRDRDLKGEVELAGSDTVRAAVRQRLGEDDPTKPEGLVFAEKDLDVLVFVGKAPTRPGSIEIANAWAEEYVVYQRERAKASIEESLTLLQASLDESVASRSAIRQELDRLEGRLARGPSGAERAELERRIAVELDSIADEIGLADALVQAQTEGIHQLRLRADLADAGSATILRLAARGAVRADAVSTSVSLILAVSIGVLLGLGLVMLLELADRTVGKVEDISKMGLEVLATVPWVAKARRSDELVNDTIAGPDSEVANAHQRLCSAIGFMSVDQPLRSVAMTSAGPGEGKTFTAVNMALAQAAIGRRVVLADAHHRRPRLHEVFGMAPSPGLLDAVSAGVTIVPTRIDHLLIQSPGSLGVVAAGDPTAASQNVLARPALSSLITTWEQQSELAVIDGPSVIADAEMSALANKVDGIVIVARARHTKKADLAASLDALQRAGGRVLGVVLINTRSRFASIVPGRGRSGTRRAAGRPPVIPTSTGVR